MLAGGVLLPNAISIAFSGSLDSKSVAIVDCSFISACLYSGKLPNESVSFFSTVFASTPAASLLTLCSPLPIGCCIGFSVILFSTVLVIVFVVSGVLLINSSI